MGLVNPHGGSLKTLLVKDEKERNILIKQSEDYKRLSVNSSVISDLFMLGSGAFSPLEGFACEKDYNSILVDMHLEDGTLWPIPITLPVEEKYSQEFDVGENIILYDQEHGEDLAILEIEDKFKYDREKEAISIFKTSDKDHPGVKKLYSQGNIYLGGKVKVLDFGKEISGFDQLAFPEETRDIFNGKGWETIVAFQTRNPIHRSHEYLTKIALETNDGVFINPIVGKLKEGDIPADVRMKCYDILIRKYYPEDKVVLKVYPMEMRYAGPREAILHAIIRQNYGCSHIIIGRDHAGVGNYYGMFEAQDIFDGLKPDELLIKPLKMDWTFWCYKCDSMASMRTCPHDKEDRLLISGTKLREMLSKNEDVPDKFSRIEVLEILRDYYSKN
jgi:sulfate adenylyltransferase